VQVDPIKPTLKSPGTMRLKLEFDELRSIFAFKFSLRRYIKEDGELLSKLQHCQNAVVGQYRLTLSQPTLKALGTQRLELSA